ncbi:Thioredoxin reductase [Hartmannibacter diazotrophicus]|uniref:Thioredoxin reductase n=1 Tax=Hartmannibacter diazotrophicus TaxID=1482074 RepID=A0A2C9D0Z6_9HYPH|nr:cyclic nucleotide-binding domain-containing thioredoxin-disulfide reductase [Hartmannibacter diazotrophicus]SON53992.1 Thioredoxin reductase [Hartmannibacter diazotrophicus]
MAAMADDPTDPWRREAQTFPRLSDEMIERALAYGREETFSEPAVLFERGQRNIDFFLVLDGHVDIVADDFRTGRTNVYAYGQGQFTGEQNLFNQRKVLLGGIARPGARLLRIANADFRTFLVGEPDIGEIIIRAYILRRVGFIRHSRGGVLLVGRGGNSEVLRLRRFLSRNVYPIEMVDTDSDATAADLLRDLGITEDDLPIVVAPDRSILKKPGNCQLADALGISEPPEPGVVYDVAVAGAGPAGLAAAVYAASEGLKTIVLEPLAPGGQAGTSSKIENYLGFPTGISGMALAGRAHIQAQKFGARLSVSRSVTGIDCSVYPYRLTLDDGQSVLARSVVIATGARYRRLSAENYDRFEGNGVHYAATAMEAQVCSGQDIVVVGGGNSAGQAAVFLSRSCRHVHMLIRRGIATSMSDYLVQRIERSSQITVHHPCEIAALDGGDRLESVTWMDRENGATRQVPVGGLFVMIGASPNTEWLEGCIDLDRNGFVHTGAQCVKSPATTPYATSRSGIFAVGDVRGGSVKRVASAVGEGSVVVQAIHQFLQQGL